MTPIQKALTPEERAIVGNIKSLLTQLEGVVGEGTSIEMCNGRGNGITKADGTTGDPGTLGPNQAGNASQKQPVNPFVAKTEGGGESGRQDAEDKLGELPVSTDETLAVLKALVGVGGPGDGVQKSAMRPSRSLNDIRKTAIARQEREADTYKVLKSLTEAVAHQQFMLEALVNGKEVAEELLKVEKSAPRIPVQPSSQDILATLGQLVQKSAENQPKQATPGNMSDVLTSLWA